MLIQALHEIQTRHRYLPKSELRSLAERTQTPLYRLQEIASFFPHFRLQAPPPVRVQVCHDMTCHLRGAAELRAELANMTDLSDGGQVAVDHVSCLGRCDRAPAVCINDHVYVRCTAGRAAEHALLHLRSTPPPADRDADLPLQSPRPWKIDVYNGRPTYETVRQFLAHNDGDGVIAALKEADLRGMGGAGAPAFRKWDDVRNAPGDEKFIICNGDESEPGTFKDRELLLRTPYLVVEGVILAGLVTNATRGYIYIRHEYQEEIAAVRAAIQQAQLHEACGLKLQRAQRRFPVEVFVSPGGYICGEQSALVEAMEDRRAQPRNKPPQLETNGLYDKPTLVSNVETFAWVPSILLNGPEWYRDQGLDGCRGLRFFSISGDVNRPGAYELPNGITLREALRDHAGGISGGRGLKALAPSGPSGGFLPARIPLASLRKWEEKLPPDLAQRLATEHATHLDVLDLQLDLDRFRALGFMLGAGLVAYAEGTDMVDQALNCLEFFRDESCGKCVPCRIGSQKLVEFATRLGRRGYGGDEFDDAAPLIHELAQTLEQTSICGLGVVAANPLTTLMRYFPDDIASYVMRR